MYVLEHNPSFLNDDMVYITQRIWRFTNDDMVYMYKRNQFRCTRKVKKVLKLKKSHRTVTRIRGLGSINIKKPNRLLIVFIIWLTSLVANSKSNSPSNWQNGGREVKKKKKKIDRGQKAKIWPVIFVDVAELVLWNLSNWWEPNLSRWMVVIFQFPWL